MHDSNHGQLPHHEQKLVADILQSCQPDIVIHYIDVQKQANTSDCGLFSIAFAAALSLTFGQDPAMIYYDQEKMMQHVFNCLKLDTCHCSQPMVTETHSNTPQKPSIYCICRLIAEGTMTQRFYCKDGFISPVCLLFRNSFITKKTCRNCQSCAGNC